MRDAQAAQQAGAFSIVLECVPTDIAAAITSELTIPTIGIGAGAGCDGQVLVTHDLLGLTAGYVPRFVKKYADLQTTIGEAVTRYRDEVRQGTFPAEEQSYADREERRKGFFSLAYEISGREWSEVSWIQRWHDWYEIASRPGLTRDSRVLCALGKEIAALGSYPSTKAFQRISKSLANVFPTRHLRDSSLLDELQVSSAVAKAVRGVIAGGEEQPIKRTK